MLFLTIPHRHIFYEDLLENLRLEDGYKHRKRVRPSTDLELIVTSPKVRKTSKSDKFEVKLDVAHFKPEDINIKANGDNLIVEGKHGERLDENGYVSRQFTRRYQLPKDIDLEQMTSSLSSDGKLLIEAPIKQSSSKERVIPITFVEKSQDKKEDKKDRHEDNVSDEEDKAASGA